MIQSQNPQAQAMVWSLGQEVRGNRPAGFLKFRFASPLALHPPRCLENAFHMAWVASTWMPNRGAEVTDAFSCMGRVHTQSVEVYDFFIWWYEMGHFVKVLIMLRRKNIPDLAVVPEGGGTGCLHGDSMDFCAFMNFSVSCRAW